MKKIFIKIQVCGQTGTGKTCIGLRLANILKKEGFDVAFVEDFDTVSEDTSEETISRNLKSIAPTTQVLIETVQTRMLINV